MNGYLPMAFVLLQNDSDTRSRIAQNLLPAMIPVAESQRMAVAAIAANQQVQNEDSRQQQLVSDVVQAIVSTKPEDQKKELTDEDLKRFPTLANVVRRNQDIQRQIESAAVSVDLRLRDAQDVLANDVAKAFTTVYNNPAAKLTDNDLKNLPVFASVLNRNEALKAIIVPPPTTLAKTPAATTTPARAKARRQRGKKKP